MHTLRAIAAALVKDILSPLEPRVSGSLRAEVVVNKLFSAIGKSSIHIRDY